MALGYLITDGIQGGEVQRLVMYTMKRLPLTQAKQ